jgi:hypothetical protein
MEHISQALKALSSRQALMQAAMEHEDAGQSRALKVACILS